MQYERNRANVSLVDINEIQGDVVDLHIKGIVEAIGIKDAFCDDVDHFNDKVVYALNDAEEELDYIVEVMYWLGNVRVYVESYVIGGVEKHLDMELSQKVADKLSTYSYTLLQGFK